MDIRTLSGATATIIPENTYTTSQDGDIANSKANNPVDSGIALGLETQHQIGHPTESILSTAESALLDAAGKQATDLNVDGSSSILKGFSRLATGVGVINDVHNVGQPSCRRAAARSNN